MSEKGPILDGPDWEGTAPAPMSEAEKDTRGECARAGRGCIDGANCPGHPWREDELDEYRKLDAGSRDMNDAAYKGAGFRQARTFFRAALSAVEAERDGLVGRGETMLRASEQHTQHWELRANQAEAALSAVEAEANEEARMKCVWMEDCEKARKERDRAEAAPSEALDHLYLLWNKMALDDDGATEGFLREHGRIT